MNHELTTLALLLSKLETKFGVDVEKVHLLNLVNSRWNASKTVRVTDLLKAYTRTSRATTHRMVKELVSGKILAFSYDEEDKRAKYLIPGAKFKKATTEIQKVM